MAALNMCLGSLTGISLPFKQFKLSARVLLGYHTVSLGLCGCEGIGSPLADQRITGAWVILHLSSHKGIMAVLT